MRLTPLLLLFCLASLVTPGALRAEGGKANPPAEASAKASLKAMLVVASKEKGKSDPRLADYEPTLRRLLRFESFQLAGSGEATVTLPGSATVQLGDGQSLVLKAEAGDGGRIKVAVQWQGGGGTLMNTGLMLRPGVPAVLGGPAKGDGGDVYAVLITAG